ncbi:hypothetical protein GCM10011379_59080 [Filimonas zeae]|uniref:Cytochrome P450 n=1 Tax=Filimonas zeae TaxID=1737353 RepID=A0A917J649_9BACT|nr:hypothetical protein GCM10011379_59080 [Filimonas zeae]
MKRPALQLIPFCYNGEVVANPNHIYPTPKMEFMHFGHEPHLCTGRYISQVTVPELVAALLRLPNLQRAPGKAGKIQYEEVVFPKSLCLT